LAATHTKFKIIKTARRIDGIIVKFGTELCGVKLKRLIYETRLKNRTLSSLLTIKEKQKELERKRERLT